MSLKCRRTPMMYRVDLSLAWVEALEQGRCPESLSAYAHGLLAWRRSAIRATTTIRNVRPTTKKKKTFTPRA